METNQTEPKGFDEALRAIGQCWASVLPEAKQDGEWYYLREGDIRQEGDELSRDDGPWEPVKGIGLHVKMHHFDMKLRFRRRVSCSSAACTRAPLSRFMMASRVRS